ncbi:MAG: alpha/beta hydrolase [Anaerolineae bacterium]|jgi:pimeloyl-ACP methyl ester carboxylesterase|nr:MAG: alpha/beta hydrolase [Anaerolineae bacterium]
MKATKRCLFLHGLDSSSQGVKATYLRQLFPAILTPDFHGSLEDRMFQLCQIIGRKRDWTLIGSSFGGLMATYFACWHPKQVKKMILLAPALIWPDLIASPPPPIDIPVVLYHGTQDTLIPLEQIKPIARQIFRNLDFHAVEDDHSLLKTFHTIDWQTLIGC